MIYTTNQMAELIGLSPAALRTWCMRHGQSKEPGGPLVGSMHHEGKHFDFYQAAPKAHFQFKETKIPQSIDTTNSGGWDEATEERKVPEGNYVGRIKRVETFINKHDVRTIKLIVAIPGTPFVLHDTFDLSRLWKPAKLSQILGAGRPADTNDFDSLLAWSVALVGRTYAIRVARKLDTDNVERSYIQGMAASLADL